MLLELCMRRTYGKDPLYGLLLTFGAALVIEELIRVVWGSNEKQLPLPDAISGAFLLGDLLYARYRLFASGFAIVMIALLWLFLEKTPYGAMIKAGAHDSEMVRALGVNLPRLRLFVFALGVALAAIAGVVMAPIWGIRPHVGVDAVVPAFLIIVLGGVGSLWGAVIAGCWSGWSSAHRRVRVGMVAAVDVSAVHRRRHVPRARLLRPQERARRVRRSSHGRYRIDIDHAADRFRARARRALRSVRTRSRSSPEATAASARPSRGRWRKHGADVIVAGRDAAQGRRARRRSCAHADRGARASRWTRTRSPPSARRSTPRWMPSGRLDILVNCVGIQREEPLLDVTEEAYDEVYRRQPEGRDVPRAGRRAPRQVAGRRGGRQRASPVGARAARLARSRLLGVLQHQGRRSSCW